MKNAKGIDDLQDDIPDYVWIPVDAVVAKMVGLWWEAEAHPSRMAVDVGDAWTRFQKELYGRVLFGGLVCVIAGAIGGSAQRVYREITSLCNEAGTSVWLRYSGKEHEAWQRFQDNLEVFVSELRATKKMGANLFGIE